MLRLTSDQISSILLIRTTHKEKGNHICLISINQTNRMSADDFHKAFVDNGDGIGFAWFKDGQVHFKKGFMVEKDAFAFSETLDIPFVTHFRSASYGMSKAPELTHPFIISKDSPLILEGSADAILFHNGTEHAYEAYGAAAGIYLGKDEISNDSRMIARVVAANSNGNNKNNNYDFLRVLKSKFVLGDKDEKTFIYYGTFIEDNGIWYSNMTWRIQTYSHCSKKKTTGETTQVNGQRRNYYKSGEINIYEYPWNRFGVSESITKTTWERSMGFRYMMNKITLKSAQKIWKKLSSKKHFTFEKAEENALKIFRQQGGGNVYGIDKWLTKRKESESVMSQADKIITDKMKEQKLIAEQSSLCGSD